MSYTLEHSSKTVIIDDMQKYINQNAYIYLDGMENIDCTAC